jgi:hypothetical protein
MRCSWCGAPVEDGDGFRAYEPAGDRTASFCRLEHVVPWAIRGARWEPGTMPRIDGEPRACSHCDDPLSEVRVVLVGHRGKHRIPDGFCSVDHLREWATAGGRWQ